MLYLPQRNIFSMLKFDYILFTVNNFKTTISMKLPYVTSVEPPHSPLIDLCNKEILHYLQISGNNTTGINKETLPCMIL